MRIISQDGRTDIPYENFVFGILKDNCIVAVRDTVARPSEVCQGIVAEYSTEAKAQKAIEMLREKYKDYARATNKSNFFTMFDYPKVFQFPKDEDVEV